MKDNTLIFLEIVEDKENFLKLSITLEKNLNFQIPVSQLR